MTRTRDLSGFRATPPPRAQRSDPKGRTQRASAARRRPVPADAAGGTRRITLSLPSVIADDLKTATRHAATYYLDVILNAFVDHAAAVRAEHDAHRPAGDISVAPPRRRRPSGRTQIPLNIPESALAEIDEAAGALGMNRSGFVAELLERAL